MSHVTVFSFVAHLQIQFTLCTYEMSVRQASTSGAHWLPGCHIRLWKSRVRTPNEKIIVPSQSRPIATLFYFLSTG